MSKYRKLKTNTFLTMERKPLSILKSNPQLKRRPFAVPEGYFENELHQTVQSIVKENPVVVKPEHATHLRLKLTLSKVFRYAACIAVVLFVSGTVTYQVEKFKEQKRIIAQHEEMMRRQQEEEVTLDGIIDYLSSEGITASDLAIAEEE